MSWGLFGQIILLIVIYSLVTTAIKCIHDACCKPCKK